MEYDRGALGARVEMVVELIMLGADSVAVAAVIARASDLRSGVRYSREAVEEK